MKIAFHVGDITDKAENELAARMTIAAKNINIKSIVCRSTNDIAVFDPDFIFSLHTSIPKLTQHITLGCMWNPPHFFANDMSNLRKAISYDVHLAASARISQYLNDLSHGMVRTFSIGQMLPSCQFTPFRAREQARETVAYLGTNWDGFRYADEMTALSRKSFMRFFGPSDAWQRLGGSYAGPIPFDGTSVVGKLFDCGVTLSLHRPEHIEYHVPSMRVFEAVASSSILISDHHSFVKENFSDTVFYVDSRSGPDEFASNIQDIFSYIQSHPKLCTEMAREAHRIFEERFTLEVLLQKACETAMMFRDSRRAAPVQQTLPPAARVDCIVRTGFRSPEMLRRALRSVAAQTFREVRVIVINNNGRKYVRDVVAEFVEDLNVVEITVYNPKGRSHSLWEGLKNVTSEYFCILDDDDRFFPSHLTRLVSVLDSHADVSATYGGAIRVIEGPQEDEGEAEREERELTYYHPFDRSLLMQGENYITSNSFVARTEKLNAGDLIDPELDALEDLWLLIILASGGDLLPTWEVSSEFFWRRGKEDNITFNKFVFDESLRRIRTRLQFMSRPPVTSSVKMPFQLLSSDRAASHARSPMRHVHFVDAEPAQTGTNGFIDSVQIMEGSIELVGWAHWKNVSSGQRILVFGVKGSGAICEVVPRPDVAVHMDDWRYYLSGFRVSFGYDKNEDFGPISLYAVDDDGKISLLVPGQGVVVPGT